MIEPKPILKWAGGKRQLLNDIRQLYPSNVKKYCEPFVGGGTVFFDVVANLHPEKVLINDINPNLINVYIQIRDNPAAIINKLKKIASRYLPLSQSERADVYYFLRDKFNQSIKLTNKHEKLRNAVLFIFLNRTCFNGLYRVNSSGQFNVPVGSYKNPTICDEETIKAASNALKKSKITCGNYSSCLKFIDSDTFVYFDPPYRPITETSFVAYSKDGFNDNEQIKLKKFVDLIHKKGAHFAMSNSDPKNLDKDDNFFDDLYSDYVIERVFAKRAINSKKDKRGSITEILVHN